jgi:hypothetical protein
MNMTTHCQRGLIMIMSPQSETSHRTLVNPAHDFASRTRVRREAPAGASSCARFTQE